MVNTTAIRKGMTNKKSKQKFSRPEGAGNFDNMDDFNIVDSMNTNTGTIQHTPANDKDIVNKAYVDSEIFWQKVGTIISPKLNTDTIRAKSSTTNNVIELSGQGGGPRVNFGQTTNVNSFMEIGAFSSINNIDTKSRDLKIFSNTKTLVQINNTTGLWDFQDNNLTTTGIISTPEIFNTAGNLKIQPDVQGDVTLFEDTDIADAVDGKKLVIHRKAAEFDDEIEMYITSGGDTEIKCAGNLRFRAESNVEFYKEGVTPFLSFFATTSTGYQGLTIHPNWQFRGNLAFDQLIFAISSTLGRQYVIADYEARGDDYAHVPQDNPTMYIHSSTRAGTATDEWLSLTHDVTDAIINWGSGDLKIIGGDVDVGTGDITANALISDNVGGTITITGSTISMSTGNLDFTTDNIVNVGNIGMIGDLTFAGTGKGLTYGSMSVVSNATETTITTQNVYVQVTNFDTNGVSNNSSPDHTNDHITITKAGDYKIECCITANSVAGAGATFEFEVQKNNGNVRVGAAHGDRTLSGGGSEAGSITICTIATLAIDDTLELWVKNETNTQNIIIEDASMSVTQVGG